LDQESPKSISDFAKILLDNIVLISKFKSIKFFFMLKSLFKPFVVMVTALFAMIFLVSTTVSLNIFAENSDSSTVILVDNSTTKDLNLCINNQFLALNNKYPVIPGKNNIQVFYGKTDTASSCDNQYIQFKKVFESNVDLKAGQTYIISVTGKAELTGVIKHNKTVLISQTDILNMKKPGSIISWKTVDTADIKTKNAICVNKKIMAEDNAGSHQVTLEPGFYKVSFEYDQSGAICNPKLPDAEGHTLELDIGCECDAKYEISVKRDDDYNNAKYLGLNFATKMDEKVETAIPPIKPTPSEKILKPIATNPSPAPITKPIPTTTVRSGGENNTLVMVLTILLFSGFLYSKIKTKQLKWS
jgi:hypothetical protein